jgi:hypothetical protein
MRGVQVHGVIDVEVIEKERDPVTGKAFLRIQAPDGTRLNLTLNAAAMLGGVATGAIQRFGYDKERAQ